MPTARTPEVPPRTPPRAATIASSTGQNWASSLLAKLTKPGNSVGHLPPGAEGDTRLPQDSVTPWSLLEVCHLHYAGQLQVSGLDACERLQDPRFRQAWLATREFEIGAVRSGPVGQITCHRNWRTERRFRARQRGRARRQYASLRVGGRPELLLAPGPAGPVDRACPGADPILRLDRSEGAIGTAC